MASRRKQREQIAQRRQQTLDAVRSRLAAAEGVLAERQRQMRALAAGQTWMLTDLAGRFEVLVTLRATPASDPVATVVSEDPSCPALTGLTVFCLASGDGGPLQPRLADGAVTVHAVAVNNPALAAHLPGAGPAIPCALTSMHLRAEAEQAAVAAEQAAPLIERIVGPAPQDSPSPEASSAAAQAVAALAPLNDLADLAVPAPDRVERQDLAADAPAAAVKPSVFDMRA